MKIVIDAKGGDKPEEIIKGAISSASKYSDIEFVIVGKEAELKEMLAHAPANITILNAEDVVTNDDPPTHVIRRKPESSMVKGLKYLKENDDAIGMISTGSTGALLTGAILLVGRIDGVRRPTLASLLPTSNDMPVCIADSGANVDSTPEFLQQFAFMANEYYKCMYGIDKPNVALLSVGTEDHKGNAVSVETFGLLKDSGLNFVGNIEARDALSGKYHVIVSDGFAGNVLLKSVEGTAKFVMKSFKEAIMSGVSSKIGYLFMKKAFTKLKDKMDYHAYGGAPFLGVKKAVFKSHGSSNAKAICVCVDQVLTTYKYNLVKVIGDKLGKQPTE